MDVDYTTSRKRKKFYVVSSRVLENWIILWLYSPFSNSIRRISSPLSLSFSHSHSLTHLPKVSRRCSRAEILKSFLYLVKIEKVSGLGKNHLIIVIIVVDTESVVSRSRRRCSKKKLMMSMACWCDLDFRNYMGKRYGKKNKKTEKEKEGTRDEI